MATPGPNPGPNPRTSPRPTELATRAATRTRLFGAALLATLLVTALALPWRLSGLGFGALTIYSGARLLGDLRALRRAGLPATGSVGVTVGIVLTGLIVLVLLGEIAFYPLVLEQDRCLAGAITHQDQQQCQAQVQRRQQEILRRLEGPAASRS